MNKILTINDEEKLRSLLARIINIEDFEIVETSNCKLGL